MKSFFRKLDRLLTKMAFAEAGDLDTVKEMLREDSSKDSAIPVDEARQLTRHHSTCTYTGK